MKRLSRGCVYETHEQLHVRSDSVFWRIREGDIFLVVRNMSSTVSDVHSYLILGSNGKMGVLNMHCHAYACFRWVGT